jgi:hypothetical protein
MRGGRRRPEDRPWMGGRPSLLAANEVLTMPALIVLVAIAGPLFLVDLLAVLFGVESRDGFVDPFDPSRRR